MSRRITYLLGAGASYHAIPVVDGLNDRMEFFVKLGLPYQSFDEIDKKKFYQAIDINDILGRYRPLLEEALKHRTIDTFAKKLFLQKKFSVLRSLKEFLCLYFAFEQSDKFDRVLFGQNTKHINEADLQQFCSGVWCHLDYRYDVFLATLLNEKMELPSNINIISWNYDHQLELAYMDFAQCNFKEAKTNLKIYPNEKTRNGQIIKLNGSANQFVLEDHVYTFEGVVSSKDLYLDTLQEISRSKNPKEVPEYALNFAWERNEIQMHAISLAKHILENTDELIIIGYSFPNFNRSVDIEILKQYNARSIRVQCVEKDFGGIKQSLIDIYSEDIGDQIHFHNDLTQFYIPSVQFYNQ